MLNIQKKTKESKPKAKGVKKPKFGVIAKVKRIKKISLSPTFIYALLYFILWIITRKFTIFTPDFGESDAFHINFSYAKFLSDNLKNNKIPLWTNALQGGLSLIAEGQSGLFFIPNLVILRVLPFNLGYNLLFFLSFFLLSSGIYLVLKELRVDRFLAFLIGLNFPFFSVFSLRLVHLNFLQGLSLLPISFYFFLKLLNSSKIRYFIFFIITLQQVLSVGQLQAAYLILFNLLIFFLFQFLISKEKNKLFLKSIILGLAIASAFLLTSFRFLELFSYLRYSLRNINLGFEIATLYPFRWENLLTLWNPYIFGDPRRATYPIYSSNWGIFWENTFYFGKIFFLFFILSSVTIFFLKDKRGILFLVLTLFYLLLALGKYSPLYFLYNFPPFDTFRVPGRYLVLAAFTITILTALVLNAFFKKRFIKYLIAGSLLINLLELVVFAWSYHQKTSFNKLLESPQILKYMDLKYNYITLGQTTEWNKIFLKKGWGDKKLQEMYLFFKNFLYPNSNLIYGAKTLQLNGGGLRIRRSDFVANLVLKKYYENNCSALSWLATHYYIKYFITSKKTSCKNLKLKRVFEKNKAKIFLFESKVSGEDIYYFPEYVKQIKYEREIRKILDSKDLNKELTFIESNLPKTTFTSNSIEKVKVKKASENYVKLTIKTKAPVFVVIRRSFLPGWEYFINKKNTNPIKADLIYSGFYIPKGEHTIIGRYSPVGKKLGIYLSSIGLIFLGIGALIYKSESFKSLNSRRSSSI